MRKRARRRTWRDTLMAARPVALIGCVALVLVLVWGGEPRTSSTPGVPVMSREVLRPRGASAEACTEQDLASWLPDEADIGYWVICVHDNDVSTGGSATVYTHVGGSRRSVTWGGSSLAMRRGLEQALPSLREQQLRFGGELLFEKQPFSIFNVAAAAAVFPVSPGMEGSLQEGVHPGVAVLLGGGRWRWPPMRRGFERQVGDFLLRTLAVRPALFVVVPSATVVALVEEIQALAENHPSMGRSSVSRENG